MKKFLTIISISASCLFLINMSENLSSPEYCSGTIYVLPNSEEKIIDIKIGTSKAIAGNRDIKVYKQPHVDKSQENKENKEKIKEKDLVEYHIDLKRVSKIEVEQIEPIVTYGDQEYVKIKVISPTGVSIDCIIPKKYELICKLKNTGWTASYPFNKIKHVIVEQCAEIQETSNESKKCKEVAVNDLKRACEELEKHTPDKKLNDLKHRANNVLEEIKNTVKD